MVLPAVPSWAPELLGQFAVQVFSFSFDAEFSTRRHRLFVTIAPVGADYEMTATLCEHSATNSALTVRVAEPSKLPPMRHKLLFQSSSFSTEPLDTAIGFHAELPPECQGKLGQAVSVTGRTCRCLSDVLPQVEDDCRVFDPDSDGLPGYSLLAKAFALPESRLYGVTVNRSKFVHGAPRVGGGFVAQQESSEASVQFACQPSCLNLTGTLPSCAPEQSEVTFVLLDPREVPSGWTCAAILDRAGKLFPDLAPAKPEFCAR
jgi:hypothetical protein